MSKKKQDVRDETIRGLQDTASEGQTGRETISAGTAAFDVDELEEMLRGLPEAYDDEPESAAPALSSTIAMDRTQAAAVQAGLPPDRSMTETIAVPGVIPEGLGIPEDDPEDTAEDGPKGLPDETADDGADDEGPKGMPDETADDGTDDEGPKGMPEEGSDASESSGSASAEKTEADTAGAAHTDGSGNESIEADAAPDAADDADEEQKKIAAENAAIRKKIIQRRREKKRKARNRKIRFWTILSILLLSAAAFIFSISGFFTVDSIEVRGNSHFTGEEIINIAHAVPGHNIIYDADIDELVGYLEENPYIKSATVARKLPSTLVITVTERQEAFAFKYDDDYLIMDDEGILLRKTRTEPKITMVTGMVVTRIRLGDTIGTKNQQMMLKLLRLIRATKAADMYFVAVDMSAYEEDNVVKAYIYDKLVVRGDYQLLTDNLKNGRLHKVVEKLFQDGIQRGTITFGAEGVINFEPGL